MSCGNKILTKYKMKKDTQSFLSPHLQKKYNISPDMPVNPSRRVNFKNRNQTQDVIDFFLRDDVSTVCPDKKGYTLSFKNGKVKKRKRYLRGPLTELYEKYTKVVPNPVSYTTFTRIKPFYCVHQKMSERDTCLCTTCENFLLLTQALKKCSIIQEGSPNKVIASVCCDPKTEDCLRRKCDNCVSKSVKYCALKNLQVINFKQWKNVQNTVNDPNGNVIKKSPKWKKVDCSELSTVVVKMFEDKLLPYMAHIYRDSHQQHYFREVRKNLGPGDIYIHFDWSKNYGLKSNREIQSAYFGASNEEISLHTGMVYVSGQGHGFCTLSENNKHTAPFVLTHLIPIVRLFFEEYPGTTTLYLQSDSPTSQYRNKDMFFLLTQYLTQLFPQITKIVYGYSEGGHSKGEADGIGGWCKSVLDQEVLYGEDVSDVHEAFKILTKRSEKTRILLIGANAHEEVTQALPKTVKGFEGTASAHAFTWVKELKEQVFFSTVSCMECEAGTNCSHFGLPNSPLIYETLDDTSDVDQPQPLSSRKRKSTSIGQEPVTNKKVSTTAKIALNDWVAVAFEKFWYPGMLSNIVNISECYSQLRFNFHSVLMC